MFRKNVLLLIFYENVVQYLFISKKTPMNQFANKLAWIWIFKKNLQAMLFVERNILEKKIYKKCYIVGIQNLGLKKLYWIQAIYI